MSERHSREKTTIKCASVVWVYVIMHVDGIRDASNHVSIFLEFSKSGGGKGLMKIMYIMTKRQGGGRLVMEYQSLETLRENHETSRAQA